jgi:hypothetical protein
MNQVTRLKRVDAWGQTLHATQAYAVRETTPLQRLLVWSAALAFCVGFWVAVGFAAALLFG